MHIPGWLHWSRQKKILNFTLTSTAMSTLVAVDPWWVLSCFTNNWQHYSSLLTYGEAWLMRLLSLAGSSSTTASAMFYPIISPLIRFQALGLSLQRTVSMRKLAFKSLPFLFYLGFTTGVKKCIWRLTGVPANIIWVPSCFLRYDHSLPHVSN